MRFSMLSAQLTKLLYRSTNGLARLNLNILVNTTKMLQVN
jgi:hypothetical protein